MKRGQRVINGKVYSLGGRVTGFAAKTIAENDAAAKRKRGHLVRLIKLSDVDYLVYQL
jgi:hypothetical protein